jgi:hypothetical protein
MKKRLAKFGNAVCDVLEDGLDFIAIALLFLWGE